ncbi:MAG: hypothetical protein ABFE16_12735 [Armatimonadia bacterium]
MRKLWCVAFLVLSGCAAEQVRVPVVADTSLQLHPSEQTLNSGASSAIRVKGNEHYLLMKFDLARVSTWRVTRATLHLHYARPGKLRTLGLSTIAADWQEGTGTSSQVAGGCTFLRSVWPEDYWAGPGSDFLDVALTNGNTLVRYTDLRPEPGDWFAVDVDPVLVQAMICGGSFGLCLTDEKGQTMANNDLHSREQNAFAPYLVVEGAQVADGSPATPVVGSLEPWPAAATFDTGALRLQVTSPGALRHAIDYTEAEGGHLTPLPRYLTPPPTPGGQWVVIPGLKPQTRYEIRVAAVDECGRRSAPQSVTGLSSVAKPLPSALPRLGSKASAGPEPPVVGGFRVWACPAECKVHPVSGNLLEEVGAARYGGQPAGSYRRLNPVWDAEGAHLEAARGEVVALQVVVENVTDMPQPALLRVLPADQNPMPQPVGVYRNWYVRDGDWYAEYLAPIPADTTLPAAGNKVPGQRNQSFTILWEVPRDAPAGIKRCTIALQAATGALVQVPVRLRVYGFEVPARTSFEVDLNCYGPVYRDADWDAYLAIERKYYAAAHALRANLTSLGYSHSGNVNRGYAPKLAGEGSAIRVVDWEEYDRHWGPYLDGSAFGGVRAGVPVTHLYLPFHEAWPTPIAGHYSGGNDLRKYPDNIIAHALTAPPVEQAFDQSLRDAFIAVTRQFVEHCRERGWTRTDLHCYLNNKFYYKDEKSNFRGTSWWLLDEPQHRDDWLALRFFANMFWEGVRQAGAAALPDHPTEGQPRFLFRGDISRPQFQRNWLDGCINLMCVSSELFSHPQHCRRFRDQGVTLWHYGEANPVKASNLTAEAWALKAYCAGADGILPWNSLGGDSALDTPTPTALLVPGDRFGLKGPVVSLRVLALCRGQQDVEYLNLLAARKGYDRDQMARLVAEAVRLIGGQQQLSAEDAGRMAFEGLTVDGFAALRTAVARALED